MATNMIRKYSENLVREWLVPAGTQSGTLVIEATSQRIGVTLTARGDSTKSYVLPNGQTLSGIPNGGVSARATDSTVATDGTWAFAVAGIVNGGTGSGEGGTPKGTAVYRVAADGTLTLTASTNLFIGRVDDGTIVGGFAPIQIGIS